jgi:hypothetical protein
MKNTNLPLFTLKRRPHTYTYTRASPWCPE